ncbi:MAG TPA: ABC transporter permease [Longimicrobiaceae bacterium]|nr:ABC transporter permease [Longimicrobiaceae bacterium]
MPSLLKDLRYGARKFSRNPGFTAVSVLTMALGIGLTTMMFSIVNGAILKGLPFAESGRLMHLERNNLSQDITSMEVTLHDFPEWRQQQRSFEDIAGFYTGTVNVSGTERAERYDGAFITANAFRILRVQPLLGRTFREGEDQPGAAPTILLGYRVWQDRYSGDRGIIGKTVRANGEEAEVIGVMPEGFEFPISQDLWVPLREELPERRGEGVTLEVFGRLRDGVSLDQAQVQMGSIARRLAAEYPESNEGVGAVVKPYTEEYIDEEPRLLLFTMLGAVFGVLLIACANVANLLLGQAAVRSKEVGIRTALGASRGRIVMQFLTEPLVLAALGATFGLGLAWAGIRSFNAAIESTQPPFWIDIGLDPPVLAFTVGITLLATLLSGLLPALRASGGNVTEVLKDESRGSSSFRGGRLSAVLVVVEIALSVGLLAAAGLMIKSVTNLRNVDMGFRPEQVFTARVGLPESEYPDSAAQVRFFDQLQGRLAASPDLAAVALSSALPGIGSGGDRVAIEGKAYADERAYPDAHTIVAGPGSFDAFGVKLRQGRDFGAQDREGSLPVTIVNESFARTHFGQESPLGRRIRLGGPETEQPWLTIVGVAPDMFADGLENEEPEAVYLPYTQSPQRFMSVVARPRAGEPGGLTAPVRDLVAGLDPDLPIYFVDTLAGRLSQATWFYKVFGTIFMVMGFVALFLASIGLYGVMAFSVSRRTREMGVRMALGAQAGDVRRLILRQGLKQLAIGVVLGLLLAFGLGSLLRIILFQVSPADPVTFVSIVTVLVGTGVLACLIPARRATRVDPMVALRYE